LPKHLYEGTDILNNPYNNAPVGTGAFVFKKWKRGEYLILEKNRIIGMLESLILPELTIIKLNRMA
jgi:hypothetical protein